jgi:hypothetical protein
VARDYTSVYPEAGLVAGIGPLSGQTIAVSEMVYSTGTMRLRSPNGMVNLDCESSGIAVDVSEA